MGPALLVGGDDVGVRREEERAARRIRLVGAEADDHVAAAGLALEDDRLEPFLLEDSGEVLGGGRLAAGRVRRVDPDELS